MADTAVRCEAARVPDDIPAVRALFEEYAAEIGIDLCFQGFAEELANLPGKYAPPGGGLWLAVVDGETAGCVALRPLEAGACEIKRLYVRPAFRGRGIARLLATDALAAATAARYRRARLDTLSSMTGAIALYQSLGFVEIEPYYDNPIAEAKYFGKELGFG
jgi:ribosomal protein S18 acetylase RimI-like enzyme